MSTELIINATLPETRIALLEDSEIQELHIERDSERGIVGNIYKGKVIRVLPGMQAAFVDIGLEKAAFLYVDDIYFPDMKTPLQTNPLPEGTARPVVTVRPTVEVAPRLPVPVTVPVSVSPVVGAAPNPRGDRHQGRGKGRGAGRHNRNQVQVPKALPATPVSPEDHARLQQEYARLMLGREDEFEDVSSIEIKQPPAPPQAAPATLESSAPEALAAQISPEQMQLDQPEARSPEPLLSENSDDDEGTEQIEASESGEGASDDSADEASDDASDDAGEESGTDAPVVYRAEPIIDAEAWVDDIADDSGEDLDREASPVQPLVTPVQANPISQSEESGNGEGAEQGIQEVHTDYPGAPLARELRGDFPGPQPETPDAPDRDDSDSDSDDEDVAEMPRRRRRREQANIADLVKEGQDILVQVAKDPIGTKGARLTCHVSLPGRYLVFMPTVDHIGVSRRIESEGERRRLKDTIGRIRPSKTGVIVRTASGKQTDKKLKADLDYLVATWNDIQKKFNKQRTPSPVYQDLTIVLRAIRDMFTDEVDKVVVDSKREHKLIMKFVTRFIPHVKDKIELYEGDIPIFDAYGIEQEITRSLERKVWLKSGGYLVVDQAEALVAIDVNTGRYVGKKTLEETILKTNLEAVKEIAYQLRLRNCGGIIILDLIDMEKEANKDKVFKALEEALKKDRARPTIMKISQLGLIEMTRKRTRDSLVRSLCEPCAYCEGKSYVKNKLTIAYDIMRDLEREGAEKDTTAISIQCHPSVADVLLEDKRDVLEDLEHQFNKKITIRGNGAYHVEQYELVAHRDSKNMVWSSEERRQLVRQRAQERAQRLVAEQRKKESDERERRRKEQEEARQKVAAEREERRKVLESLLEKRRQQIDALRTLRKQEAEERRAAAIASGQDPETLIVEEIIVTEAELEPLIGPDGQPITLLQLEQQLGGGRGGGADRQDRNRRRRRRGRRGKPGPRAGHHAGGRHREPHHRGQPAQTAGAEGPSSDEGAYNAPSNVDQEHYSSEDLAGSVGGGDDDGDYSADSDENIGNAVGSPAEPGAPRSARSGAGADSRANQNRRRRGRRGGRRHRFRRRPPGGAAGAGQGTSSEGGGPSDGPTPVNVSGSDNKGGGFSDPQE